MAGNRALGSQMEEAIAAFGGSPAEHPVSSKYATAEQMERLIAAVQGGGGGGGIPAPANPSPDDVLTFDGNAWIAKPGLSDEQIEEAVDNWLDDHPEATTTVEDGAITQAKLASDLAGEIFSSYVAEEGCDLVPGWEKGDIDSSGNETSTGQGSFYRTPAFAVDPSKYYFLTQISEDTEGTTKSNPWANTTYGVIHCYSDNAYLGVATPGSGNSIGIFTPLTGTTKIRLSHALVAHTTLAVYEIAGSDNGYRTDIIPTGHDDVVVQTLNNEKIEGIEKDQLGFLGSASDCILDKNSAGPWFVFSRMLISQYIQIPAGTYMMHTVCTNLSSVYVRMYDENKGFLQQVSIGNYQTPVALTIPSTAKYVRFLVDSTQSAVKLSDLTTFKIYRYIANNLGYGADPKTVIDASVLPVLPPLALTGQISSGILCLGHGGASSLFANDSIESFYAIARNGFNGTEVDIQFTKDHVPVCWHNPTLSTLTGGTANDHIYDYTLEELDETFDFRTWYDPKPYLRSTVARFEEVCILARAYGWWIMPDKLTSATGAEATDMAALIAMIKKYGIEDHIIVQHNNSYLVEAFPNNPMNLTAMAQSVDESWVNGLLHNQIPDMCHQDADDNYIVDDEYTVYTSFNWAAIKASDGVSKCADITDLMTKHNVKTIWYTCESPTDIYQLVANCPKTAILLSGAYTVADGMNEYLGIKWSNMKFDLSPTVHQ